MFCVRCSCITVAPRKTERQEILPLGRTKQKIANETIVCWQGMLIFAVASFKP
jgi:hypothetical protein